MLSLPDYAAGELISDVRADNTAGYGLHFNPVACQRATADPTKFWPKPAQNQSY